MAFKGERSPRDWYHEAERWYAEEHQGCPHCRGRHCVFHSIWGRRREYYCSACDFSACHDVTTGLFMASLGDGRQLAETLLQSPHEDAQAG
jgi:hypothetical protein